MLNGRAGPPEATEVHGGAQIIAALAAIAAFGAFGVYLINRQRKNRRD